MSGAALSSLRRPPPADPGWRPTRSSEAFEALYRAHAPGVHAAAYRVLGREGEAEDITQEVFVRYWRDPDRFDPSRGELGGYLRLMARSRALDLWRQEQAASRARDRLRVVSRREEAGRPEDRPASVAERAEQRELVRTALSRLPADQREALVLYYWGSMSADEIARRAGVPFGTARSRMRLGLEKLRRDCPAGLAAARQAS